MILFFSIFVIISIQVDASLYGITNVKIQGWWRGKLSNCGGKNQKFFLKFWNELQGSLPTLFEFQFYKIMSCFCNHSYPLWKKKYLQCSLGIWLGTDQSWNNLCTTWFLNAQPPPQFRHSQIGFATLWS